MAAATVDIKVMTNLYVLPYRNPYLAAKALGSLDLVSGGRLIAGVGAGYLRSELSAVGVDIADRARLFDEALGALWSIWMDPETSVSGAGFEHLVDQAAHLPVLGRIHHDDRLVRNRLLRTDHGQIHAPRR